MKRLVLFAVLLMSTMSLVSCDCKTNQANLTQAQRDSIDSVDTERAEFIINYNLAPNHGYLIRTIPIK